MLIFGHAELCSVATPRRRAGRLLYLIGVRPPCSIAAGAWSSTTGPVMRRRAGFDANEARRQLLKERQHISALQLTTKDHLTIRVNAMNLKDRLRDIETDSRNRLHDLAPPNHECPNSTHIDGACCAGGGAVHSISCGQVAVYAAGGDGP